MRFVNLNGRAPKTKWLRKAKRLLDLMNAAPDLDARKAIIKSNEAVWKELLPWLRKIMKGKCWFSESRGACHYWEVEHFRPKGAAKNLDGSERAEGYWWLAFDWNNFRFCGGVPNRKKGCYFPLRQKTHIATSADRNIDDESPCLLDPTKPEDPLLLAFDRNGDVAPTPGMLPWNTLRATVSIERYKLQGHEEFVEARRDVWVKCEAEINKCMNLMKALESSPCATANQKFRAQVEKLREMGGLYSEFSAVANACLRSSDPYFQKIADSL